MHFVGTLVKLQSDEARWSAVAMVCSEEAGRNIFPDRRQWLTIESTARMVMSLQRAADCSICMNKRRPGNGGNTSFSILLQLGHWTCVLGAKTEKQRTHIYESGDRHISTV